MLTKLDLEPIFDLKMLGSYNQAQKFDKWFREFSVYRFMLWSTYIKEISKVTVTLYFKATQIAILSLLIKFCHLIKTRLY